MVDRTKTPTKLTTHEKYVAQVRAEGRHCSPFRLGMALGSAGDNLRSPYTPGSRAEHSYLDGLEYGRTEHKINAKACELYHASSANDPSPAWWELSGAQKWPWREKAIAALAGGVAAPSRRCADGLAGVWSYWAPTQAEREAIYAGAMVRLGVVGITHPPLHLGVDGVEDEGT
jgi:hypothetical protein